MVLKNIRQVKFISMVFFLVCLLILCSCGETIETPSIGAYTITYEINGHGKQPENLTDQTNLPNSFPMLIEEGWIFEGWYLDDVTLQNKAEEGTVLTDNVTLYAKWTEVKKYSITFVTNGHGQQPEKLTNQTYIPSSLPVLSENGWIFEGWYLDDVTLQNKAEEGTVLTDNVTLYAKWTEVKKYSITFVTNGYGKQPENLTNQTYIPSLLPVLREAGWEFEGWYLDDVTFQNKARAYFKMTEDITLYAKWTEIIPFYIVDYEINNNNAGTLIGEAHQIVYRGEDTTPVTIVPNIGYKFLGWSVWGRETERADELTRVDMNVQRDLDIRAVFQGPITCLMEFRANEGGKVEGITLRQSVLYGDKGEPVTAIPDEGFRFVRWSDGETGAVRTNEYVTYQGSRVQIYAEFERYKRDFILEYNEATSNTEVTEYTFYLDDMEKEQYLPVPQREGYEFVGWYSDWFHEIQVTDETGKMIVDRDWFNTDNYFEPVTNPDMKLFAKWKPTKEVPVYNILLIYVTEVHATLESNRDGMIQVDYVMSGIERKVCELVSLRMESYLEAILNGTVDFQIDSYFTKEPLTEENFYRGSALPLGGGGLRYDYGIDLERGQLPEVNNILDDYGSVLASFSLNDNTGNLHVTAGHAGKKYGNIYLDFLGDVGYDLDLSYPGIYRGWISRIGLYIHEFTHTIEFQLKNEDNYELHNAAQYLSEKGVPIRTGFDYLYSYLRNEFNIGDRNVGIPYEFWTGEYEKK